MQTERPKVYFTDGEGPVVFKDLARDVSLQKLPKYTFDTISMWVAHNSQGAISPLEPGDTLSLLVPHLLLHRVSDDDLREEAKNTTVARGADKHLRNLQAEDWEVRLISTAYEHLWDEVGPRINIPRERISDTKLNLASLRKEYFTSRVINGVKKAEETIDGNSNKIRGSITDIKDGISLGDIFSQPHMQEISQALDELYFCTLPDSGFPPLDIVSPIGGEKKVTAIKNFANELKIGFEDVVYVGDSITDDKANKFIRENGGLSIAVNGDIYAIRNANIAIATEDMSSVKTVLDCWQKDGMNGVKKYITEGQFQSNSRERDYCIYERISRCSYVTPECLDSIVSVHRETRAKIRGKSLPLV